MQNQQPDRDKSFIIRFWLEERERRAWWRGRVMDVDSDQSKVCDDCQSILDFIRARLAEISRSNLPMRRGRP